MGSPAVIDRDVEQAEWTARLGESVPARAAAPHQGDDLPLGFFAGYAGVLLLAIMLSLLLVTHTL